MRKSVAVLSAVLILVSGCHRNSSQGDPPLGLSAPQKAWWECKLDLGKIEALRGRNLDDLNQGGAVARNQFLMDCMTAKDEPISLAMLDEMTKYAAIKRKSSDVRFNRASDGPVPE